MSGHPPSILTDADVQAIRAAHDTGETRRWHVTDELARRYGVARKTVLNVGQRINRAGVPEVEAQ